jgi:hypothetical protein
MKSIKTELLLTVLFIVAFSMSKAQNTSVYYADIYYPTWNNPLFYYPTDPRIKDQHIQSQVIVEEKYRKGNPKRQITNRITKFDRHGNDVEFSYCKDNGKIRYRTTSVFDSSNNRIEHDSYRRARHISTDKSKYDKLNNCIEYATYGKNGKIKRKMEYDWDSTTELQARSYKNGIDLKYKWVFEYYPDKTSKKTTKYNSKGKVKKVWTYDCNLLGDVQKKHEDTVKMCRFDSSDLQGYYYRIVKKSMENGKLQKTIYKYSKDSLYMGHSMYDEKNRLKNMSEISYSGDTAIKYYRYYNKKGRMYQYILVKQDKQYHNYYSESCWKSKKCAKTKYVSQYLYDKNGLLLKVTTYHGPELYGSWNYFYTLY